MDMVLKILGGLSLTLSLIEDLPWDQTAFMLVMAFLLLTNAGEKYVLNGAPIYA